MIKKLPEIGKYLKEIENELGDIDPATRKSIIQEIDGHLEDKIEDIKKSKNVLGLPPDNINKVLKEFGEPQEVAREYKKQIVEDQQLNSSKKRSAQKILIISILVIVLVFFITIVIFYSLDNLEEKDDLIDNTIYEGKGLNSIQIGDNLDEIKIVLGEPEQIVESNRNVWVKYNNEYGLDFLLNKTTMVIKEIRFNQEFGGKLENGISIGFNLDDFINISDNNIKIVEANYTETQNTLLGIDRVLYKQIVNGNITAYKFVDAKSGYLLWFDFHQKVTQIVVFNPIIN